MAKQVASEFTGRQRAEFGVRATLSLILVVVGVYVILSGSFSDAITKWAIGVVGLVIGYWFR